MAGGPDQASEETVDEVTAMDPAAVTTNLVDMVVVEAMATLALLPLILATTRALRMVRPPPPPLHLLLST